MPFDFVVNLGSNILSLFFLDIPIPLSSISIMALSLTFFILMIILA
jgi:hypothetical protein